MNPILIVEDDEDINELIVTILKSENYLIEQAYSGTEAKLLIDNSSYSLVILDLMLPGLTGENLINHLRSRHQTPVIILSAKDTKTEKVRLLRLGADDYITKPFDADELVARIEAVFRRSQNIQSSIQQSEFIYKDIMLNTETHQVLRHGTPVLLTAREFAILKLMMETPSKVFTKANLYESVWNDEFLGDDNTVNVHISNLRTKLKDKNIIQTVWGIGFKLQS